jgi:hypothetical protein
VNTLRFFGPAGILAVSSLTLLASLPANAPAAEPLDSIEVRMKAPSCSVDSSLSPILGEVRATLRASLDASDDRPIVTALASALDLAYGDRVTLTAAPVEYVWLFVNGIWVRHCQFGGVFEIDFGSAGTVVVTGQGSMLES